MLNSIDYEMYPWGNAYYNVSQCASTTFDKQKTFCWAELCGNTSNPPPGCFSGTVLCQHGKDECDADAYETCARSLYPKAQYAEFLTCFEGVNQARLNMVSHCASVAKMNFLALEKCFYLDRPALDAQMAKATAALGKAKLGTPWVLLNGVHVEPTGMLKQVCSALAKEGKMPSGCQKVESQTISSPPRSQIC